MPEVEAAMVSVRSGRSCRRGRPLAQPAKQFGRARATRASASRPEGPRFGFSSQRLALDAWAAASILGCDNSDKTVEQVRQDAVDRLAIGATQPVGDTRQGQLLDEGGHLGVEGRSLTLEPGHHRDDFAELPIGLRIRQAPGLG